MRRIYIVITFIAFFMVIFTSCNKKDGRIIPYSTFKEILVEVAFMDSYAKMIRENGSDTISIYEPIFEKYGYDVDDIKYTLENIASRKSNVVVVLIEDATKEIDKLKDKAQFIYDLNTKSEEKGRLLGEKVLYENNIPLTIKSLDSLENYGFDLPIHKSGEYRIQFKYMIDSLDDNSVRYFHYILEDSLRDNIVRDRNAWLQKRKNHFNSIDELITVAENEKYINRLKVQFLYLGKNQKTHKKPNVTIDSVKVLYYPDLSLSRKKFMDNITGIDPLIMNVDSIDDLLDREAFDRNRSRWMDLVTLDSLVVDGDSLRLDSLKLDSLRLDSLKLDSLKVKIYLDSVALDKIDMDAILGLYEVYMDSVLGLDRKQFMNRKEEE